jgi:hypothetical protein
MLHVTKKYLKCDRKIFYMWPKSIKHDTKNKVHVIKNLILMIENVLLVTKKKDLESIHKEAIFSSSCVTFTSTCWGRLKM